MQAGRSSWSAEKALPPSGEADPLLVPASPRKGDTKGGPTGHEEPLSRRYSVAQKKENNSLNVRAAPNFRISKPSLSPRLPPQPPRIIPTPTHTL